MQCAEKVAPYIHAKLIAVEQKGSDDAVPFVVRLPPVIQRSEDWQAAATVAIIEEAAPTQPSGTPASTTLPEASEVPSAAWLEEVARNRKIA